MTKSVSYLGIHGPLTVCLAAFIMLSHSGAVSAEQTVIEKLQEDAPKNWGRWGQDDQLGAINYLDQEQVLKGAAAIKSGRAFTLQIPMTHGSGPVFPGRVPTMHFMAQDESSFTSGKKEVLDGGVKFSDDAVFMYLQGTTHVDALGHAWYNDQIYGGASASTTTHGHAQADIAALAEHGITGRGILLDLGRSMGKENNRLAVNTCIDLGKH